MQDGVEEVQFFAVVKNDGGKAGVADGSVRIENVAAELPNDLIVGRGAGLNERVRDFVGLENRKTAFAEHAGDGAFAAGDASGETVAEHEEVSARNQRVAIWLQWPWREGGEVLQL